ncbi:MAG: ABC transporter ATP-binding protein/permease [Ruminococcus bromii]|nr:ABC transporter ATP-binding protein/permease [Ruminococcus bromii]MDD6433527.1 ABC transporter ATP-binding protein [Ruminococcus bromii]MDY4711584.1 ABC transporter ATP-binding protein [Ruminococcus bromii]
MIRLRRFLKDYKKECIIGPICKLVEAILELFVPLVMAKIIDVGVKNGDSGYVIKMGGLLVLLAALGLSFALVCQYWASKASQGFGTKVRSALFAHINSLSHAELDKLGTPSLITRMTNDINQVQQSVAMSIRLLTRAPFIVAGALVMAMTINLKMSVIFFISALLIAVTLYFVMSKSIPIFTAMQKKLDKIGLISRENLSGNRVIRAFSKQKTEKERIDNATEDLAKTSIRVSRLSALLSPVTYAVTDLAIVAVVWFGAMNVNNGSGMLSGDIIALVNYLTQILLAMIVVANLVILLTKASASAKRIDDVFKTQPSVVEKNHDNIKIFSDNDTPKIKFSDVSFTYGDGADELSNISFEIKRGQTVGIIGGTGSGKSTLIGLIPRFYDVKSGCVSVDGVNVKEYPFLQLRGQMGIVPQQSVLFSGTVRDNMKWGNKNATDEEIIKALKIAQAYEFVSKLPKGLDSYVEQGGKNFSGGQKQRLCIARGIATNPKILILDDSFSALDFATDAALRKALKENTENMTVIIVTQRCSTIRNADLILVMDDGELAGQGTHEELFDSCETYRDICLSQLSETEAKQ